MKKNISGIAGRLTEELAGKTSEALWEAAKAEATRKAQELHREIIDSQTWKDVNRYVQDQPLKALLITFGVGMIFGIRLRR